VQSYLLTLERALLIAPHQSSTRKPDILVENRDFLPNPPAFEGGGFRRNIAITFGMGFKVWLPMVKKMEDVFIRFDRIHERDGRTDRQTDGQTPHDGIGGAYA